MIAENLVSDVIVPLRTSDTGEEALGIMNEFYVRHLPIVNNEQLLGLVSEEDILNMGVEEPIGSYKLSLTHPFVHAQTHVYEIMRLLAEYQLTVIPVVGNDDRYVGLVTMETLLRYFAESGAFREPGSILVLEMGRQDYSLAEIARIIESENAVILSCFVQTYADSARIEVTLKINRQNIGPILASFQRFDYQVKASFNETDYQDALRDRYDALMTYLNV